jgi:putative (di)nucleoside polyphosphate hydrolase
MSIHQTQPAEAIIDAQGYRANVGIILCDDRSRLFWARRVGRAGWQFPQGGIQPGETPQQALYRELNEEVGLGAEHVQIMGSTQNWLRYRLPERYQRPDLMPLCIGQKQIWFLVRFTGDDAAVRLDAGDAPEFDDWCWVEYWHPLREVIFFKREVYQQALSELAPLLFPHGAPSMPDY